MRFIGHLRAVRGYNLTDEDLGVRLVTNRIKKYRQDWNLHVKIVVVTLYGSKGRT